MRQLVRAAQRKKRFLKHPSFRQKLEDKLLVLNKTCSLFGISAIMKAAIRIKSTRICITLRHLKLGLLTAESSKINNNKPTKSDARNIATGQSAFEHCWVCLENSDYVNYRKHLLTTRKKLSKQSD